MMMMMMMMMMLMMMMMMTKMRTRIEIENPPFWMVFTRILGIFYGYFSSPEGFSAFFQT